MDKLNRDVFYYLIENYLSIFDVSNLAKTAKQFNVTPTDSLILKEGIEFCVKKGKIELLDKFSNKDITSSLLKTAILHKRLHIAKYLTTSLELFQHFDSVDFLMQELLFAIKNNKENYLEALLKFDDNILQNDHHRFTLIRESMYCCDLECVKNIVNHLNLSHTDPRLAQFCRFTGRDDVLDWLWPGPITIIEFYHIRCLRIFNRKISYMQGSICDLFVSSMKYILFIIFAWIIFFFFIK